MVELYIGVIRWNFTTKFYSIVQAAKRDNFYYDNSKNYLESKILLKGDVVLLAYGGHGFYMIEPSEIIEVKQGPYSGDKDKTRFNSVKPLNVTIK